MNWLDLLIVALVFFSVLGGLMKGFARAAIGLAATLLALFCGIWFYDDAAQYIQPYVSSRAVAGLLGFLAICIGIMVAGALIAALMAKIFHMAGLSWLNRLLGGAFGVARGVVVSTVLVMLMLAFDPQPPAEAVAGSRLAPYVAAGSQMLADLTPVELKAAFSKSYERVKEIWAETLQKEPLPVERI